jgi:hypothetical protein
MRILILSALMALGLAATGCHTTCDARGPSEYCEIHHTYMETRLIINDPHPKPSQEYLEARAQSFIHSYPYFLPDKCEKVVVYVCPDCVRAEQEWRRRHPNGQ